MRFYRYSVKFLDFGGPSGIRTRVAALKGLCPRPLDDGTLLVNRAGLEPATTGLKALVDSLSHFVVTCRKPFIYKGLRRICLS